MIGFQVRHIHIPPFNHRPQRKCDSFSMIAIITFLTLLAAQITESDADADADVDADALSKMILD